MLTLVKPLQRDEAAMALDIDRTMRAKLPELPNPLIATWDERQRLVLSRGEPWIVGPLEIDPYLTKAGGYPFPDGVAARLHRISQDGARFHRIAIAHEADPKGRVAELLPAVGSHGLPVSQKQVRDYLGKTPAAQKPRALAESMDNALRKTAKGLGVAAGAVGTALAAPMLDPIVFGVIGVSGQPASGAPAIFYPLAAWVW
jgi:hypothetical protein